MMKQNPILIVMLTYKDRTVANAYDIFEQCKNSQAEFWGFKETREIIIEGDERFC